MPVGARRWRWRADWSGFNPLQFDWLHALHSHTFRIEGCMQCKQSSMLLWHAMQQGTVQGTVRSTVLYSTRQHCSCCCRLSEQYLCYCKMQWSNSRRYCEDDWSRIGSDARHHLRFYLTADVWISNVDKKSEMWQIQIKTKVLDRDKVTRDHVFHRDAEGGPRERKLSISFLWPVDVGCRLTLSKWRSGGTSWRCSFSSGQESCPPIHDEDLHVPIVTQRQEPHACGSVRLGYYWIGWLCACGLCDPLCWRVGPVPRSVDQPWG